MNQESSSDFQNEEVYNEFTSKFYQETSSIDNFKIVKELYKQSLNLSLKSEVYLHMLIS